MPETVICGGFPTPRAAFVNVRPTPLPATPRALAVNSKLTCSPADSEPVPKSFVALACCDDSLYRVSTVSSVLGVAFPFASVRRWAIVWAENVPACVTWKAYRLTSVLSGGRMT